ncbi:hypothetical protein Cgig2_015197 [Carnegiea gigantea]|uniref:Uncharacterized protein n=1 Tax=Carnegiea gigantea TaxID=171969 RepID=A0A9Q1KRZ9_9CARY|nr:hypothetical protein Cgig2_015197 [Carnegiea gigantea]
MESEAARGAKESLDLVFCMSNILESGLDRHTLLLLVSLCELGFSPEVLAALVKELRVPTTLILPFSSPPSNSSTLLFLRLSHALSPASSLSLNSILAGALACRHGQTQARPGRHGNRAPSPHPFQFSALRLSISVCAGKKKPGKARPPWIPSTKLGVHWPTGLSGRFPVLQPPKSGQMRKPSPPPL